MRSSAFYFSATMSVLAVARVSANKIDYFFYDLGNLGYQNTYAYDINNLGQLTGSASSTMDTSQAILWENGVMIDLDVDFPIPGSHFTCGEGISDRGTVIGHGWDGQYTGSLVAAFWDNDEISILPLPTQCEKLPWVRGINSNGTLAVGYCSTYTEVRRPLVWDLLADSARLLPLLESMPAQAYGYTNDVNDDGLVIGYYYHDGVTRSFTWVDGVMAEIVNTLGGEQVGANVLNNLNTIAGWAYINEHDYVGMLYKDGTMTPFDYLALESMNDSEVMTATDLVGNAIHPLVFAKGVVRDLIEYFPTHIYDANTTAINNYGWIVGYGKDVDENYYAWLVVPIYAKGDYDGDDDVDIHDFGHFQRCFAAEPYQGPEGGLHVGCSVFDFDDDVDLDLTDYDAFQSAFTGPITSGW